MQTQRGGGGGPFEAVDSKLTIYALANGMDLVKETGTRRLGWYREGREREVLIEARPEGDGFRLTAAAFRTRDPSERAEHDLGSVGSADELVQRLSALLQEGQERANELDPGPA